MVFQFHDFELDIERRELRGNGDPIAIPPKVFALLVYLVERSGRMVSKSELLDALWTINASEASLQTAISQLRKALRDNPRAPAIIKTHHGRGFRFVAPLTTTSAGGEQSAAAETKPLRETRPATVLYVRFFDRETDTATQANPIEPTEDMLEIARSTVEAHQGKLLHMMMDGFTAVFGLARTSDHAPRLAVYCAMELAETLASFDSAPAFAIETGPLEIADRDEATAWAPPSAMEHTVTALAKQAQRGDILVSDMTLNHLRDEVIVRPGTGGHLLVSVSQRRSGIPARPARLHGGFVGRDAEMAFLETSLTALRDGRGQAVTLSGPAGIGKSRLVNEFLARLEGGTLNSLIVPCLPALANTPLAPVREMCAALFGEIPDGLTPDPVDQALLRDLMDETSRPDPALARLSDHQRRTRRNALVDHLLSTAAADQPLVLVFEDVHWIDASSHTVLRSLVRNADKRQVLLLLTTRPVDRAPLSEAQLQLSPLGHGDSLALLRCNADLADFDDGAVEILAERAAGNPFYLEELALAAREGADPAHSLPGTVQAVISARIAALDDRLRTLLYAIAVIGAPAPVDLTAQLLNRAADALTHDAETLTHSGFLSEDVAGFRCHHMLINDAAYAMVSPSDRARLHGEIARLLESGAAADQARPERLAWHYQEAGETDRAIDQWSVACRQALRRSAHHEAIGFAEAGIALVSTETTDAAKKELDLRLAMALALTVLRGYGAPDVGKAYSRAGELNRTVRSPELGFQLDIGLWLHNWVLGQLATSFTHAEALLAVAEKSNAPALKAHAHASAGEILVHQGQLAAGYHHLCTGVSHLQAAPPDSIPAQNAAVSCAAYAGWAAALMGNHAAARQHLATSEEIRDLRENPFAAATHAGLCAGLLIFNGDVADALAVADEAIRISREHRFPFWLGSGLVERGWALGQLDRAEEGVEAIEQGIAIFEATGAGVQLANWYGFKAETLLRAVRLEEGLAATDHALGCAGRTGDIYFAPRIHAVAAALSERLGDNDRAVHHDAEAKTLAERFGMGAHMLDLQGRT